MTAPVRHPPRTSDARQRIGMTPRDGATGAWRVLAQPAFRNAAHNPYTTELYRRLSSLGVRVDEFSGLRAIRHRYDIWHLHWPESYPNKRSLWRALRQSVGLLLLLSWARRRGTCIVWTVHNLASHERVHPVVDRWFRDAFVRRVDAFIALSQVGAQLVRREYPRLVSVPSFVVHHGHYRDCYPNTSTRRQARQRLGVPDDATVLTFLGQIRPYKNVPALIESFRSLPGANLRLLVAGRPQDAAVEEDLRRAAAGDERIRLHYAHLADEDIQLYLNAADLVVLPYAQVLNSGSAILALSFNRPVLVPHRGALEELRQHVGGEWVRTYEGVLSPALLADAIAWSRGRRAAAAPLDALEWARVADATLAAYASAAQWRRRQDLRDHASQPALITPRPEDKCTPAR